MASANVSNRTDTIKGSFSTTRTILADGETSKDPVLAAAKIGKLTTRTSNSVGTLTMNPGHGFVAANRLDLYWLKPDGTRGFRYGITVGAVAGDDVPITAGAGDNLPDDESDITAMVPQQEAFTVPAASLVGLVVGCDVPAIAVFMDVTPAQVLPVTVDGPSDAYTWDTASGIANPFGADVVTVYLSHGSSAGSFRPVALALRN